MLTDCDRSSNMLSHPITVHWHWANQFWHWPCNTRHPAGKALQHLFWSLVWLQQGQGEVIPHHERSMQWNEHLVGLVVKAFASRAADPRFDSCLRLDFSKWSHTSDLKIGSPVATLPGAWRYRVGTGTSWLSVSILWLGEVESLICNFCCSVAACTTVWADLSMIH